MSKLISSAKMSASFGDQFTLDQFLKLPLLDILKKLASVILSKKILSTEKVAVISSGHFKGVDPGAINSNVTVTDDLFYHTEVEANEDMVKRTLFTAMKNKAQIFLQAPSGLLAIIQASIRFVRNLPAAVLIQFHHDMYIHPNHPLINTNMVIIYYGSQKGYSEAFKIKEYLNKHYPDLRVDLRHQSERKVLGFIVKTFHTALIIETGFISQHIDIISYNQTAVAEAVISLYGTGL